MDIFFDVFDNFYLVWVDIVVCQSYFYFMTY